MLLASSRPRPGMLLTSTTKNYWASNVSGVEAGKHSQSQLHSITTTQLSKTHPRPDPSPMDSESSGREFRPASWKAPHGLPRLRTSGTEAAALPCPLRSAVGSGKRTAA